jgi:hypothetical protein
VYLATAGGALRPVARGATSGGGASVHVRTVSVPALAADGAHWLFTNSGELEYFGAFARRGPQASPRTKAVAFAHDGDTAYFIDGGPGAEFNPLYQPGGAFALKADDAVAYRRHAAQPAARAPAALSAKKKGPARRKLPPGRGRRAKARGSERVLTPLIGSHPAVL